jgi:hypothetical protein
VASRNQLHDAPTKLPRGAWRTEVDLRIRELRSRLAVAQAEDDADGQPNARPPDHTTGTGTESAETLAQKPTGSAQAVEEARSSAVAGSAEGPLGTHELKVSSENVNVTVEVKDVPARSQPPAPPAKVRASRVDAVQAAIAHATEAISDGTLRERLVQWWTGGAITAGWESVHDAETELIDIESEADVRASLPHIITWLQQVMPTGEPRKHYEGQLSGYVNATKPLDRTTVRLIYKDVVSSNNESKANLRAFRNLLSVLTMVLALVLVVIAVWHAIDPGFISLCSTTGTGASSATTCLSDAGSRGQDVLEVELMGAIGGLLSLAVAFSGTEETPPSRYNVRPQQAALKVVAGAATGLVGVLIVQSGIIVSPASQTSSEALFLVYAIVFGYSQQLFTKFVDKRADALLGEPEEKEGKSSAGSSARKA